MLQESLYLLDKLKTSLFIGLIAFVLSACVDEEETKNNYKLSEISFSHYESENISVKPDQGIIVDGYLYVVLQKFSNEWDPEPGIIAVIDTETNQEVDTDDSVEGIQPIHLDVSNPSKIIYRPELGKLFLQASGLFYGDEEERYNAGGIVTIDVNTYETELLIDDSADTYNVYNMTIVSDTLGYYVAYKGWGENYVYEFNPTTGDIADSSVISLNEKNISDIEVDKEGNLWVANINAEDAGIYIVDTNTNEIDGALIPTTMPPQNITFITSPNTDDTLAVIATFNFSGSGEHITITVDDSRSIETGLGTDHSTDFFFVENGSEFYKVDRSFDNIVKYSSSDPATVLTQHSIRGDDVEANPHDMVFLDDSTAYILRYSAGNIWVVDTLLEE